MGKTFILGVGCQKGGSSWLYQYLSSSPVVDLGFKKEYHVFDAIYVEECRHFLNNSFEQLKQAVNTDNVMALHPDTLKLTGFYRDTENYFEYFDYLHYKSGQVNLVGDITPSYSALPVHGLQHIKAGLDAKGFDVKVVFLMRDPFDRIWSHVRMLRKRKLKNNPGYQFEQSGEEDLLSLYATVPFQIRTKYENTIANLESVFDPDDIHYEFYENLFNEDSIRKITSFLSIPHQDPNLAVKVNASPGDREVLISDNVVSEIVNYYRDTYFFAAEKFGSEKIDRMWSNSKCLKLAAP